MLNKTQIYGQGPNGDSMLIVNFQANVSEQRNDQTNFTKWAYPTVNTTKAYSRVGSVDWPDLIDPSICSIESSCKIEENTKGCALIIGVVGITEGVTSSYRIKSFHGSNKLIKNIPLSIERTEDREKVVVRNN